MRERLRRLLMALRSGRFEREMDAELQFHLDMRTRALEADGLSPAVARRQAHRELGNRLVLREESRDVWLGRSLDRLVQDVRFAWRSLRRSRTFSVAVIGTLALGIGANTAIFSVVDAVLLRPLPYAEPGRLVLLWATGANAPLQPLTPGNYFDFRSEVTSVSGLAGVGHLSVTITGQGPAEQHPAMSVSTDFFSVLGVSAERGRAFGPADGPDARVAVLSQRLWLGTFHGDPGVVGRTVTLNGEPFVVTGVMPANFALPSITPKPAGDAGPDLWVPADIHEIPHMPINWGGDLRTNRTIGYLRAIGRLRPGATFDQAQSDVSQLAAKMARDHPVENAQVGAALVPFDGYLLQDVRRPLGVLFGAVALVLAIACANIASLLLGRAESRRQEIAVRLALGASRWRIVRQLLTESLLLGLVAGACGIFAGRMMLGWLITLGPASLLRLSQASVDRHALLFALALASLTALVFGTLPAIQASRPRLAAQLSEGSRRSSDTLAKQRVRRVLVAGEVAIACVLLTCAALLGRSLWTLVRVDPGYDARQVLAFFVTLSGPGAKSQSREITLYESLLQRIRALPGVTSAAAVVNLPVGGDDFGVPVTVEGAPPPEPGKSPRINYQVASSAYFATMHVPLVEGRDFSPSDTPESPSVAIVNDAFVRRYWPDGGAIGRRVRVGTAPSWSTIVGVIGNVRHGGFAAPVRMEIYTASTQAPFSFSSFVVRTAGDPLALAPSIRQALLELDPTVPISGVSTLESRLRASVADTRFISLLLIAFAVVALLVAAVGIYGVVALGVVQRTREIGVRLALGASSRQVLGLLVRQGMGSALAGLVAGMALALAAGRALSGLLFGVTAHDVVSWIAVPLTLVSVALAAAYLPARRAAALSPSRALRSD